MVLAGKHVLLLAVALLVTAETAGSQSRQRSRRARLPEAATVATDVARDSFEVTRDSSGEDSVAAGRKRARARDAASTRTLAAANADPDLRIVISMDDRTLWALIGSDTLLGAPIAVSMDETLEYAGRSWRFETPRGMRRVLDKKADPVWIPPDWHYAEVARRNELQLSPMKAGRTPLSNGRFLEVRDSVVGIVVPGYLEFTPLRTDEEIVFDETLFIPPMGTLNRRIEGELGLFALDLGNGYLLHGTPYKASIGQAVTHGCIRLHDEDIQWLHDMMPVGTKVYIY